MALGRSGAAQRYPNEAAFSVSAVWHIFTDLSQGLRLCLLQVGRRNFKKAQDVKLTSFSAQSP